MKPTTSLPTKHNAGWTGGLWMLLALLAHTGWGAYPVLARYLQTISAIPSMALLGLGNLLALLMYAPFVIQRIDRRFLGSRVIWAFALVVVLRAISNVLAARYTLAVYVQLITLMTPLLIALLSAGLFRERLPRGTWPAIGFSLFGALLMMSGEVSASGVGLAISGTDWLGISMALISAICLAVYMILISRTVKEAIPAEAVLLVQLTMLSSVSGLLSLLLREDWGRYTQLGLSDWLVFGAFVSGVLLGANQFQIAALRRLGAPVVSSTMAWRLIATLVLGAVLLGEGLHSVWQVLGVVIVLLTISLYVWRQTEVRG